MLQIIQYWARTYSIRPSLLHVVSLILVYLLSKDLTIQIIQIFRWKTRYTFFDRRLQINVI